LDRTGNYSGVVEDTMTDLMQEDDKYLTTMMTSSMQKSKKLFEDSNPYLAEKMSFR
jgi:hypothetical protein